MNSADSTVDPDAEIWAEDGYVELHPAPYKTVLDGRFTLEELEAIVQRLKTINTRIASERE